MRLKIFILLFLFSFQGYSQHYIARLNHNIIKKNKVYKCVEYGVTDSINYLKQFPSEYYTIFDNDGNAVEENDYDYLPDLKKNYEIIYFHIYYKGKELAKIRYDTTLTPKIFSVTVNSYDTTGKILRAVSLWSNNRPDTSDFGNDLNNDSIIVIKGNQKRKTEYGFYGKDRKDTVYKRTLYYLHNRLDSEKIEGIEYNWCKLTRFKLTYKNSLLSEILRIDDPYGDRHTNTEKTCFSENGLPMAVYRSHWDIKTKARYESVIKFRYTFWH